jgi:hypothetical protein
MSKALKECPYLWEVSTEDYFCYVFAKRASEALRVAELEINDLDKVKVKLICFADDIINYN